MEGFNNKMKLKEGYSWKTGGWKSIKNWLIVWSPAILAFLLNVPAQYAGLGGLIAYFIKNFIQYNSAE